MTTPDLQTLARSLTKAQREVILCGAGARPECAEVFAMEPSLFNGWLRDGETVFLMHPTPFGLALRQHLQAETRHAD